jgi:hypothetical protein
MLHKIDFRSLGIRFVVCCGLGVVITIFFFAFGLKGIKVELMDNLLSVGYAASQYVPGGMHNPLTLVVALLVNSFFYGIICLVLSLVIGFPKKRPPRNSAPWSFMDD